MAAPNRNSIKEPARWQTTSTTTVSDDGRERKSADKAKTQLQIRPHRSPRRDKKDRPRTPPTTKTPSNQQKQLVPGEDGGQQEKRIWPAAQEPMDPELQQEYAEFAKYEQILDETCYFGQLEAKRGVEEIERTLGDDPEELQAQKEFETLMLQPSRVRDPQNEPDISEMETGKETASRPANRFRKIIADEEEFKNSDLTKPPTPDNPHPFDPEKCPMPPTHSWSLAPYANFVPLLQLLLDLGVDLYEAHRQDPSLGNILVNHVNFDEAKGKIYWLCKRVGVPEAELGSYLTRNPHFLLQDMAQLKSHLNYLGYRRFSPAQARKLIVEYRYWLNQPIERIDGRMGWMQRQFRMRPDELRMAIVKEPKLIAFGIGPIGGIVCLLNNEYGFTLGQLKTILLRDPRLFLGDFKAIRASYHYLAFTMRLTNDQLVECPLAMRCPIWGLRRRHEFLFRLRKANYVPATPGHIPLDQLLHPSDRHFAEHVARTPVEDYNRFIKYI